MDELEYELAQAAEELGFWQEFALSHRIVSSEEDYRRIASLLGEAKKRYEIAVYLYERSKRENGNTD